MRGVLQQPSVAARRSRFPSLWAPALIYILDIIYISVTEKESAREKSRQIRAAHRKKRIIITHRPPFAATVITPRGDIIAFPNQSATARWHSGNAMGIRVHVHSFFVLTFCAPVRPGIFNFQPGRRRPQNGIMMWRIKRRERLLLLFESRRKSGLSHTANLSEPDGVSKLWEPALRHLWLRLNAP